MRSHWLILLIASLGGLVVFANTHFIGNVKRSFAPRVPASTVSVPHLLQLIRECRIYEHKFRGNAIDGGYICVDFARDLAQCLNNSVEGGPIAVRADIKCHREHGGHAFNGVFAGSKYCFVEPQAVPFIPKNEAASVPAYKHHALYGCFDLKHPGKAPKPEDVPRSILEEICRRHGGYDPATGEILFPNFDLNPR
jgi:hypothetical protein